MAVSGDRTTLLVEIDATSSLAIHTTGLGRDLTEGLQAAGLPTTITVSHIGDRQEVETRGLESEAAAAVTVVIYQVAIYLPSRLTEYMVKKAVDELAPRIRRWLRKNDDPRLEVPIYGPDGKTVIKTVTRDAADT